MSTRDEFTKEIKAVLAFRVGCLCSNPDCRVATKGPHTDDYKATSIGEACHIHAAAPGGPRFDVDQSAEERSSATNGIWLCSNCATKIDRDEDAYPAETLRAWKAAAEAEAARSLGRRNAERVGLGFAHSTDELLGWPQTLEDGTWLERPEMARLLAYLEGPSARPLILLGAPGSGKSALLARLGKRLQTDGYSVLALKADRLPREVSSLDQLGDHLGLGSPLAAALDHLGTAGKTVLLVDQLDALSDLVDQHTQRLSVVLELIRAAVERGEIKVICSAREFDFRHDIRFSRLDADQVRLELPPLAAVTRALGAPASSLPNALKELLRTPQWLKTFQGLVLHTGDAIPTTWLTLLEELWQQKVLRPAEVAAANEALLRELSSLIADREEFTVARALLPAHGDAIERLVGAGVLVLTANRLQVGFAHQSLYEFARARGFVATESLVEYAVSRQDSLFVRASIWTALTYLREADSKRYQKELDGLFGADLRPHLRLLLIEFVGRQREPEPYEIALFLPVLDDARWKSAAFEAASGSPGWFRELRPHRLPAAMCGEDPGVCLAVLERALRFDRDAVLQLVGECWLERSVRPEHVLQLLVKLDDWNEDAFQLADRALAISDDRPPLFDLVLWQLAKKPGDFGVRLVAAQLSREFSKVRATLPRSAALPEQATLEEQLRWYGEREPRRTIEVVLGSASGISSLVELAKASPHAFLDELLPWLIQVLDPAAEARPGCIVYRDPHLLDAQPGNVPRELPDSFRSAVETLATSDPGDFLRLVQQWSGCDLLPVHAILSYGLRRLGPTESGAVLDYLLGDPRRLCVGDFSCSQRHTLAVLESSAAHLDDAALARLECAILESRPWPESGDRSVQSRRGNRDSNRAHRVLLLSALPRERLSQQAAALLDEEARALGIVSPGPGPSFRMREVRSTMAAAEMEKAEDIHILRLFEGLPDSTGFEHPTRVMAGGSVQASREFAAFAKRNPQRALALIKKLRPEVEENPIGEAVRALSETDIATRTLETAIAERDEAGCCSAGFREDAAWALEKRAGEAGGLAESTITMLSRWLAEAPTDSHPSSDGPDEPPFLSGWGGGGMLPHGSYPMAQVLTVALLSRRPPRIGEWLRLLRLLLARDTSLDLWAAMARHLRWLGSGDPGEGSAFIDDLVERCPQIVETREGVRLVAHASSWADEDLLRGWLRRIHDSPFEHGAEAYGELIGLIGTRSPIVDWAALALVEIVGPQGKPETQCGAARSVVYLWSAPAFRDNCTEALESLLSTDNLEAHALIVEGLEGALRPDPATKRLLELLALRPAAFLHQRSDRAILALGAVVHSYPALVCRICEGILAEPEADVLRSSPLSSQALVQLSVTLQRLPEYASRGLTLFERLLELGCYGARRALDDADVWPRRSELGLL